MSLNIENMIQKFHDELLMDCLVTPTPATTLEKVLSEAKKQRTFRGIVEIEDWIGQFANAG
jgi:hypothetical protein